MTDQQILAWKMKYNEYLTRHIKAVEYLDNVKVAMLEREKWIPKYQEVLKELEYTLCLFDSEGIKYSDDEVNGGFNVDNN